MRVLIILLLYFFNSLLLHAQSLGDFEQETQGSRQVLFVKLSSASSIRGKMILYERKSTNSRWKEVSSFPIVVGRAGLAADPFSHINLGTTIYKKEGDGKSPAGIFRLDHIFSYHALKNIKMPFVKVDSNFYCVDDPASVYYNTLILKDTATKTFQSFEYMKRKDKLYEYGIWVSYNSSPVVSGNGSCIFIHVWQNEHTGTSGCTAMSEKNILKLIHWVDMKKKSINGSGSFTISGRLAVVSC